MRLVSNTIAAPMQDSVSALALAMCILPADLQKLAHKYEEVDLSKFLDGDEELLILGLGDLSATIPAGLRTDILFRDTYAGVWWCGQVGWGEWWHRRKCGVTIPCGLVQR